MNRPNPIHASAAVLFAAATAMSAVQGDAVATAVFAVGLGTNAMITAIEVFVDP